MKSTVRQHLKAQAHSLKPIVLIGDKGLTTAVINEIDQGLTAHELIKVKVRGQDKEARLASAEKICLSVAAQLVHRIGNVLVLYRENKKDA